MTLKVSKAFTEREAKLEMVMKELAPFTRHDPKCAGAVWGSEQKVFHCTCGLTALLERAKALAGGYIPGVR